MNAPALLHRLVPATVFSVSAFFFGIGVGGMPTRANSPRDDPPSGRRAAEQRDELAALHSITSSARGCRNQGTSTPSALAS
jgi:hypothetical protein